MDHFCPMHAEIRRPWPGHCPKCGMPLVSAVARLALLRQLTSSPWHLAAIGAAMAAFTAAAMMLIR